MQSQLLSMPYFAHTHKWGSEPTAEYNYLSYLALHQRGKPRNQPYIEGLGTHPSSPFQNLKGSLQKTRKSAQEMKAPRLWTILPPFIVVVSWPAPQRPWRIGTTSPHLLTRRPYCSSDSLCLLWGWSFGIWWKHFPGRILRSPTRMVKWTRTVPSPSYNEQVLGVGRLHRWQWLC